MTGPKREYPQFKFDSFNLENGLVLYGLGGLPILLLCKFITFDVSSHDLIPVLVPEWGGAGMGGGLYLYLLLAVVSFTVAWLAWSLRRPRTVRLVFGLLLLALAPAVGWFNAASCPRYNSPI
jgi:hypothetical protein